jgi:hypothetical protein
MLVSPIFDLTVIRPEKADVGYAEAQPTRFCISLMPHALKDTPSPGKRFNVLKDILSKEKWFKPKRKNHCPRRPVVGSEKIPKLIAECKIKKRQPDCLRPLFARAFPLVFTGG